MNITNVPTPCYVVDKNKLISNLDVLKYVEEKSGAKVLLAQKAFSMYSLYPLIGEYISGTTASGLYEAKLGYEEMKGKEVHVYSPAYTECDMKELVKICDHIVFNTPEQYARYKELVDNSDKDISCGIRINPEYSEVETEIYNPCAMGSRLGTIKSEFEKADLTGITGIHFHTMCEQGADVLMRTLDVIEDNFAKYLHDLKWINLGGGHHITKRDYDVEALIERIIDIRERYGLKVYIEPGEAIALDAGVLVSSVIDIMHNDYRIAILDSSAACHMPDVLEMPYRPEVTGAGLPWEKDYTYRFAGPTCLAGDVIGDYSFDWELRTGDKVIFKDMAIYTMVKNNTFNGMKLPSIAVKDGEEIIVIKEFSYDDFKNRLG